MKTTEKRFEDKLIGAMRDAGFFCIHPNIMNQDGFPDLIAVQGDKVSLIEVKVAESLDDLMDKSFQPTQYPFYVHYTRSGGGSLWISFDIHGQGHLFKVGLEMLKKWKELTWAKALELSPVRWFGPPWLLATQLRQHLRGEPWAG